VRYAGATVVKGMNRATPSRATVKAVAKAGTYLCAIKVTSPRARKSVMGAMTGNK
jgi:hypothetical protein